MNMDDVAERNFGGRGSESPPPSQWGGKREGAGRPRLDPNGGERKNRPIYCTIEELSELKNYLTKIRKKEDYKVDNLVKFNQDWQNGYKDLQIEYEKTIKENESLKKMIIGLKNELEEKGKGFFERFF